MRSTGTYPSPDVNIGQVEQPIILLSDGGGNTLWVTLPQGQHQLHVVGCVLPNLEARGLLRLVGFTQLSHDCMHIPCAPCGSDLLHDLNRFFIMGQRSNHCPFLRLVRPSGRGICLVCDSGGSPAVNGSPIPGRFTKCSCTGHHRNPIDVSPGGGSSILEAGPEGLFFIASLSMGILFNTPSLSRQRAGSVNE